MILGGEVLLLGGQGNSLLPQPLVLRPQVSPLVLQSPDLLPQAVLRGCQGLHLLLQTLRLGC